jgi:hypothetical protein
MTAYGKNIRNQIKKLKQRLDHLETELSKPGVFKRSLISQIQRALAEIKQKEGELKEHLKEDLRPLSSPKVFGSEVTQGLPEYELVAGKDTLIRVFVGAKVPDNAIASTQNFNNIGTTQLKRFEFDHFPAFATTKLDFATLQVSGPNGLSFETPAQMSGRFTNFSKSFSEDDNVNFYISGNLLNRVGKYRFVARFYRDGILVGTNNLGIHQFKDTKDLRLLIVVDTWPMPNEAWPILFRSLEYLQRNMPIRTGIAPFDSDLTAGLRFYIDPVPFNPNWPTWEPVAQYLADFNQRQATEGKPDRADKIMTIRTQQVGEALLAGTALRPGEISGVVLNVNPSGANYLATVISQEIGHNFNLGHAQNQSIPAASMFDLLNKKSLSTALNIMYNPVSNNEQCLFSAEDWSVVRQGLLRLNSTGPV